MPPTVHVILVNWNGKADTLACLASLAADTYPAKRALVIDNGSTDGSADAVRRAHPWAAVVEAGRNLGFCGANNLGLARAHAAGSDYTYVLNNDTASEPDAIAHLVAAAEGGAFGLLAPVIHHFDEPREPWFAGARLDLRRGVAVHDNGRVPLPGAAPYEIPWASGCAMLARTSVLRALGGFDERYFLNWEDVDLSLRLRAAGRRIGLVPHARVYHKVGRSFAAAGGSTGWYYHVRNHLLLLREHGGCGRRLAVARVAGARVRGGLAALTRGRGPGQLAVTVEAIADHLRGRYGKRGAGRPLNAITRVGVGHPQIAAPSHAAPEAVPPCA